MGLFQHKQRSGQKSPIVEVYEDEKNFFDDSFREDIRNHARDYFEGIIKENVVIFKQDLDTVAAEISAELKSHTIAQLDESLLKITGELREHTMRQLDERFAVYGKEMKDAQDATVTSLAASAKVLEDQYQNLNLIIQKSIANQAIMINGVFEENMKRMNEMKNEQASALQTIKDSASSLQTQSQQIGETLQKNIATQENAILESFQGNMAQIVEHYLLGALGDQYDLKAQLPSIIKQMEANKDAIMDDMKL